MPALSLSDLIVLLTILSVVVGLAGLVALARSVLRYLSETGERTRLLELEQRIQQLERERLH